MKTERMSFGAAMEFTPTHPDRTARRSLASFDVEFKEWPARGPMARSIRMQQKRESRPDDWRACVPLRDGEGY